MREGRAARGVVAAALAVAVAFAALSEGARVAERVLPVDPSIVGDLQPGNGILEMFRTCENSNPFFDRTDSMVCTTLVGRLGKLQFPDSESFEKACEMLMTPYCRETCGKLMNLFMQIRLSHSGELTSDNRGQQGRLKQAWHSALTISRCVRCLVHDECQNDSETD